jgi:hypothetical protein
MGVLKAFLPLILVVPIMLVGVRTDLDAFADEGGHGDHGMEMEHQHQGDAVESMTSAHQHLGPHFRWTALRPQTPEDLQRAEQIVQSLRGALEKYKDYRVALEDGFQPFHPEFPQPRYHFTNKGNAFLGAFTFNPAEPTSLLYKKTSEGYELIGAMYTAPKRMTEEDLDKRVPLSIAQWHVHVNICQPPQSQRTRVDRTRFGLKGSIATEQECEAAGGRFLPQIYGWMLHVYPFEQSPEKIWTH